MRAHSLYCFKNQGWFHIQFAIAEAVLRPCIPIMDLIGVQHYHLVWGADLRDASVVEAENTSSGIVTLACGVLFSFLQHPLLRERERLLRRWCPRSGWRRRSFLSIAYAGRLASFGLTILLVGPLAIPIDLPPTSSGPQVLLHGG